MRHRSLEMRHWLSSVRKTPLHFSFLASKAEGELSAGARLRADVRRRRGLPCSVWQLPTRCSRLSRLSVWLCLGSCRPAAGRTHAAWRQAVLSLCDSAGPNGGATRSRTFSGRSPRASDRLTPTQTCIETRTDGQARHDTLMASPQHRHQRRTAHPLMLTTFTRAQRFTWELHRHRHAHIRASW